MKKGKAGKDRTRTNPTMRHSVMLEKKEQVKSWMLQKLLVDLSLVLEKKEQVKSWMLKRPPHPLELRGKLTPKRFLYIPCADLH